MAQIPVQIFVQFIGGPSVLNNVTLESLDLFYARLKGPSHFCNSCIGFVGRIHQRPIVL